MDTFDQFNLTTTTSNDFMYTQQGLSISTSSGTTGNSSTINAVLTLPSYKLEEYGIPATIVLPTKEVLKDILLAVFHDQLLNINFYVIETNTCFKVSLETLPDMLYPSDMNRNYILKEYSVNWNPTVKRLTFIQDYIPQEFAASPREEDFKKQQEQLSKEPGNQLYKEFEKLIINHQKEENYSDTKRTNLPHKGKVNH